ncbi:MAG: Transcriptional regulator, GntR family domain / Aspartate aminotransferase [Cereibacter sp.]|jgi:GntR family transcriptional regulator/MocR family aminotransferase|nr:Transcriptional regulator, GntR family domain / Aspartate aminotransferase [Cereibacter sp.]
MTLVRNRSNQATSSQTNLPDWSALIPVLPAEGARRVALYAALRRLIETGALPPGSKLPTTRDLAARLGLARGAAVAAFEMLVADGFAVGRTGAGTYVAAEVPRLGAPPAPVAAPPRPKAASVLPGTLGVATADDRTMLQFRSLLHRHLARPEAAHFSYGDPQGSAGLRAEIAAYLRSARGVRCEVGQILLTSGTQQALDLVIRATLAPGDPVWIEDPGYPGARAVMQGAGLQLVGVPVDAEGLEVALGEQRAPGARAAYVTPSHQFPLGVTLSMRRRLALIDWARRAGAWILEDDYDSEFRHAGPPLAAMQGMDAAGRVIYIGTFSKALFPGLRIGYAVLPEPLLGPVLQLRSRTDRSPPTLAEGALADFLREGHFAAHLRRARRRVKAARDALVAGLRAGPLTVEPPDQGLHLIAGLPEGMEDTALVPRAAEAGLGVRALSSMCLGPARQGLVVGFSGFAPEVLESAARRFSRSLA